MTSFIRQHNYFSPKVYTPEYFQTAQDFLKYRKKMLTEITGKTLKYIKWGFDCDENDWFHEIPILMFIDNDVYSVNNWKLDETALDKNIIQGTEFIDWLGFYDPVTKRILKTEYENDPWNFHIIWKTFDIKHPHDRIIHSITPLVYDNTSELGYTLYDCEKHYGKNHILDYFDQVYPEKKQAHDAPTSLCQSMMGLSFKFSTWELRISNALDENVIEILH